MPHRVRPACSDGSQADHLEVDRATLRLRTQDSVQVLSAVLPRLEQAGLRPGQLVVRDPSMDDVFLALTGKPNADHQSAGPDEDDYPAREGAPHEPAPDTVGAPDASLAVGVTADERRPRDWLSPVRDTFAITWRNLIGIRRVPQLMVFTLIQPVIFVLLFTYVFGGRSRDCRPA